MNTKIKRSCAVVLALIAVVFGSCNVWIANLVPSLFGYSSNNYTKEL